MKKSLFFLFLIITNLSGNSQTKPLEVLDSLERLCRINPSLVLDELSADQDISLNEAQKNYLFALANKQLGEYKIADSTITTFLSNSNFEDSLQLMQFLLAKSDLERLTERFELAIETNRQVVSYYHSKKEYLLEAKAKIQLAELYRVIENFQLGLLTLNDAYKLVESENTLFKKELLANIFNRKAAIYAQQKSNPDSVKHYSLLAIDIASEINDADLLANSYNELGYLHINLKPHNPDPIAKEYFEKAINLWDEIGYETNSFYARLNLSRYYNRKGEYKKGIDLLISKLEKIGDSKLNYEKGAYYEMLSRLYGGSKQFERGYYYADLAKEILLNDQKAKYNQRLALSSMQFELKQKQQAILNNEKKLMISKLELESAKEEKFIYLIFLIAFLIIGLIFFYSITRLSKQRNLLTKQKSIISLKNIELKEASKQKDVLLKEINHRVKNNLSILSSLLYLQEKDIKNEEAKLALRDSQIRIHSISLIHESLYQRDDMESVNFQDFLTKLCQFIKGVSSINSKDVEIDIKCYDLKPDLTQSVSLGMILNEYITNSFKYAFDHIEKPKISIYFNDGILCYKDNGPGLTEKKNERGLGLQLVEIFLTQLNSKLIPSDEKGLIKIDLNGIK